MVTTSWGPEGWQSTCVLPPPGGTGVLAGGIGSVHCTGLDCGGYTLLLTLEYVSFWCWLALCTGTEGTATGSFSECVLPPAPAHDVSVRRPIEHQLAELSFVCFRNSSQFVIVKCSIFLRGNLMYSDVLWKG